MNRLTILGYIGGDPWKSKTDRAACGFTVATVHRWRSEDGTQHEETSWIDVVVFGPMVGPCLKVLRKGSRVAVSGRLQVDRSQQDGVWGIRRAQCIAEEVVFLTPKKDGAE